MLTFVIFFTLYIQCLALAITNTTTTGAKSLIINIQDRKQLPVKALSTTDECFQNACSQSTYCLT